MFRTTLLCITMAGSMACADTVQNGQVLFNLHCAACHGTDAKGGGPMAKALTVVPTDLTRLAAANDRRFPTDRVVSQVVGRTDVAGHGGDMPVYGWFFENPSDGVAGDDAPPAPVLEIIAWLKTIQR